MAENEAAPKQFGIQKVYVKDASFEAPLGAAVFSRKWQPTTNIDINSKNSKVSEDSFEVVLTMTVTATLDEQTALLIEVQQAGLFLAKGIEGESLRQTLGITAPNMLFPYIRETIDNLAVRGGFPAIGLQPINFEALYRQAAQQATQQAVDKMSSEAH